MTVAYIFPGQGSQSIGMLGELLEHPLVQKRFKEAHDALGYDLLDLVVNGPEDKLNQTQYTQPALLTTSIAFWDVLQSLSNAKPAYLAGHSLGEYTALVAANAMRFSDAVRLVAKRGEFMQAAVPAGEGAMAAILGLNDEDVIKACELAAENQIVSAVNFNSPGQVVIAGERDAVDRAIEQAKALGAKRALPLPVSVPSHCELMRDAATQLGAVLADIDIKKPEVPVVHNVNVQISHDAAAIKKALVEQLYSPVRWVETIEFLGQNGVTSCVECGPGKVLAGLNRRINSDMPVANVLSRIGEAQA